MSIYIGKYVLIKKKINAAYEGGGGKVYNPGFVFKVIDYCNERLYFDAINHLNIRNANGVFATISIHDTSLKALETYEDILDARNPTPKPVDHIVWAKSTETVGGDGVTTSSPSSVQKEQDVVFNLKGVDYRYKVVNSHLQINLKDGSTNRKIFSMLGLHAPTFCTKHYGYESDPSGSWPNFRSGDFHAASRIIAALKIKCRRENDLWKKRSEKAVQIDLETLDTYVQGSDYSYSIPSNSNLEIEQPKYHPLYPASTLVNFDTGKVSLYYTVGKYRLYPGFRTSWDDIYKALNVIPSEFIATATGKSACYIGNGAYSTQGDWESSDKLINALKKACADLRGTVKLVDCRPDIPRPESTNPTISSFDEALKALEVPKLEVYN